jgi:hypothetical protein
MLQDYWNGPYHTHPGHYRGLFTARHKPEGQAKEAQPMTFACASGFRVTPCATHAEATNNPASWAGSAFEADPVWGLLAELAGRSAGESPGKDFTPPDDWRLPAEWLAPFSPTGTWQWSAGGGRLRVQHPKRFVVLDVPIAEPLSAAADPSAVPPQVVDELRVYAACGAKRDAGVEATDFQLQHFASLCDAESTSRLDRWLGLLMPYVRARLRWGLGLQEEDDLPRLLCKQAARVFVTVTHLDVVFVLAELPIPIRLAGLDRDPGWVPAAGRFIRFHYS